MDVDLVAINTIQEKPTLLTQIDQQQQLYKVFDIQQMANEQARICFSGIIKIGPWGGEGGIVWEAKPPNTTTSIRKINIGYGDIIDSLSFESKNRAIGQPVPSPKYGGQGRTNNLASLETDEYLTSISGTILNNNGNLFIESLAFRSDRNKIHGPYGPDQLIDLTTTTTTRSREIRRRRDRDLVVVVIVELPIIAAVFVTASCRRRRCFRSFSSLILVVVVAFGHHCRRRLGVGRFDVMME
ncbi:hypothetical protein LWI29_012710 [Acer saccharum]|uniref:Jacalin-type lectin domain-containing protein n=1 Tax=Acer saccharum TaxID=4024 RepID=A0AA39VVA3_ACESA|nr:hypothetical protein LWI29_012710 [Acer saccharum]